MQYRFSQEKHNAYNIEIGTARIIYAGYSAPYPRSA